MQEESCIKRDAALYSAMAKAENNVGGGEGLEGVYGSITRVGTSAVLDAFKQHASLGHGSVVLDIGSGLGRPLLHAIMHSNVAATFGIEVDAVKCQKAIPFVRMSVAAMQAQGVHMPAGSLPKFICAAIEMIPSLEPATHIYAAWEGFSTSAKRAVGRLFAASVTAKAITIVQRSFRSRDAAEQMAELGFGQLRLVSTFAVSMAGSARRLVAYCFVRDGPPAAHRPASASSRDLSTMRGFQPENVQGVLRCQAKERAAAKAGTSQSKQSQGASEDSPGGSGGRCSSRLRVGPAADRLAASTAANARPSKRRRRGLAQEEREESSGSQASDSEAFDFSRHGHRLRKRKAL